MYDNTLLEMALPQYKIKKPIRLIELFAGIGSQAKALKNIGANFSHHYVCEFDKYAIASYNAIHNTNFITKDIKNINGKDLKIIDTDKYDYILTYSFPCQDLSIAGKGLGMVKGEKTRSGLLWEVERLLKETKELPQILLMENVPQVISKRHYKDFRKWEIFLEGLGYKSYYKNLNAKNYRIPQNRNRVFMISILGDYGYLFPRRKKIKLRLIDLLENEVDERFYLSEKMMNFFIENTKKQKELGNGFKFSPITKDTKIVKTITTRAGQRMDDNFIAIPEKTKKGYSLAEEGDGVYINRPHQKRGCVQKNKIQTIKAGGSDIGVVVKKQYSEASAQTATMDNGILVVENNLRIRKLTPKECWRLMGFTDEDFDKAEKVNSNSQLYKQAGNSIVVNVLEEIFNQLF